MPTTKQKLYNKRVRDVSLYLSACYGYKTVGWLKKKSSTKK